MSKPELTIIDGGKIEAVELPEREDFACWKCGKSCVIWPRAEPPSVQHSLPACSEWQRIETGADGDGACCALSAACAFQGGGHAHEPVFGEGVEQSLLVSEVAARGGMTDAGVTSQL